MKNAIHGFSLISVISILITIGCMQHSGPMNVELADEALQLLVYDNKLKILHDDVLIAEVLVTSNVYFVKSFASGHPSVTTEFEKWSNKPLSVRQVIQRDQKYYLLSYDENGRIEKETEFAEVGTTTASRSEK